MRKIDERAIKAHADLRFRSEYDYALFEYYRSAKVIAFLERAGVPLRGRVLDAGCGGGGMPLSLAEEARRGRRHRSDRPLRATRASGWRASAACGNLHFALADGMALPFADGAFDLVLSHAVIEHVADAPLYLRECARVLAPGGRVYLSTAPYLSFAGAHLPRLKVPVPLHLLVGRRLAFATFQFLARHAPWTLREPANENSFIKAGAARRDQARRPAREGHASSRLRAQIAAAGLRIVREELHVTATVRRLPAPSAQWLRNSRADAGRAHQQHGIRARAGALDVADDRPRTRPDDRRAVEALYRRVFGNDAAEASRLRWDWQYRRNPNNPGGEPEIWIAREGHGHRRAVRDDAGAAVRSRDTRCTGSWGMDVMVAPERQRQGLGEVLFRTWDRNVGASLGLGLSDSSYRLFQKLRWPDVGPVPCLVKPLTRRALPPSATGRCRSTGSISALTLPIVLIVARTRPLRAEVRLIQRFDDSFTAAVGRSSRRSSTSRSGATPRT